MGGDLGAFTLAKISEEEFGVSCRAPTTLFIFSEMDKKHLPFVITGELITPHKYENILNLKGKNLFVQNDPSRTLSEFDSRVTEIVESAVLQIKAIPAENFYKGDVFNPDVQVLLKNSFQKLVELPLGAHPHDLTQLLNQLSQEWVDKVLVDFQPVRKKLLSVLQQIHLMSDAEALTTLVFLLAQANEFTSKSTAKTLALAAIFADAGLHDLEKHWYESYYRDRKSLPTHIWEKVKNHPLKSHQILSRTNMSTDILSQLVLCHHELNHGGGFHRGVQSAQLPALVQLFALAVDIFEKLKEFEFKQQRISLKNLFLLFDESKIESTKRRHSHKWVKGLLKYLGIS